MNNLTHIDLFSGIGGFALAAKWAGFETKVFCEIDPFCQKVLKKHWPDVPIVEDIKKFNGKEWTGTTLLTGGFPCQPFSTASSGKRKGKADDRYLWPEMLRIISEAKPTWVLGENVVGISRMALKQVVSDLEAIQYEVCPVFNIPACAVGFNHKRERLWICAYSDCSGQPIVPINEKTQMLPECESRTGRMGENYGVPNRVDRLRALGNAIVPQVAYHIIKAIAEVSL